MRPPISSDLLSLDQVDKPGLPWQMFKDQGSRPKADARYRRLRGQTPATTRPAWGEFVSVGGPEMGPFGRD